MKKRVFTILIFLTSFTVSSIVVVAKTAIQAEETSTPASKEIDVSSLTIDEIENMPEEKRNKLPAIEVMAKEFSRIGSIFMIELALHELKYYMQLPTGKLTPKLNTTIKEFQKSISSQPTGILLVGEWIQLMDRLMRLNPEWISLPFGPSVHVFDNYVVAKGTWVFQDGAPQADPIQTSEIRLNRQTMKGVEAVATVHYFDNGNGDAGGILMVDFVDWDIVRWDDNEIVAENTEPLAVSYTLTVDLHKKKIYEYRRGKGDSEWRDKIAVTPQILELVDGFKVGRQFHKKRQEKAGGAYAPKYKELLKRISELESEPNRPRWQDFARPVPSEKQTKKKVTECKEELRRRGALKEQAAKTSTNEHQTKIDVNSITPRKAEEIVFTGIPRIKIFIENGSQGTPEKLSQAKSIEYKCTITKMDNKYFWATRENVELIPHQSGIYTTFFATTGAGYVRIIDPEIKKILFKEGEQPYDYMEHLLSGLSTITYYGTSK